MTPRPDRPSEWGTMADHEERIRIIEALDPAGAGGASVCCPPPLDGLIITPCSVLASGCPYVGEFSVFTSGVFLIPSEAVDDCNGDPIPDVDYFPVEDTCAGQTLYMRGYLAGCDGFPVTGASFSGINVQGTHTTASFPILPSTDPTQGMMLPWTPVANFFSQSGDSPLGMRVVVFFDDTPGAGTRSGVYWFEFAWFDSSSVINPDFADVPINPGSEFGQIATWNGLAWAPLPNGTIGQVLTIGTDGAEWV